MDCFVLLHLCYVAAKNQTTKRNELLRIVLQLTALPLSDKPSLKLTAPFRSET